MYVYGRLCLGGFLFPLPYFFFSFPLKVSFLLSSVSHPCQGSQGHSNSGFLNQAFLILYVAKLFPPPQTRRHQTAVLFLRV